MKARYTANGIRQENGEAYPTMYCIARKGHPGHKLLTAVRDTHLPPYIIVCDQ
jgi:hypothetical protein